MSEEKHNERPNFRAFVGAVWKHWLLLAGGCALIVLLVVGEHISGKPLDLPLYLFLLILFVVWAFYRAWRDERRAKNELQATLKSKYTPDLFPALVEAQPYDHQDGTLLLLSLSLVNRGAPSPVLDWRIRYKSASTDITTKPIIVPNERLELGSAEGPRVVLTKDDWILARCLKPIGGEIVVGRMAIMLPHKKKEEFLTQPNLIEIIVKDCEGKESRTEWASGPAREQSFFPTDNVVFGPEPPVSSSEP